MPGRHVAAVSAIVPPASVAAETVHGATRDVLERLGERRPAMAHLEVEIRQLWAALAGSEWNGPIPRLRAERLAREARGLVDGTGSELFRAVTGRGTLGELEEKAGAFCRAARALVELGAGQAALAGRVAGLRERWSCFPRAWVRWTTLLDIDEPEIFGCADPAQLGEVAARVDRLEAELARWHDEVARWLREAGTPADDPALPVSEERYLDLLSIREADRTSAIVRTAARLRAGTARQLASLPAPAPGTWDALVDELAAQWLRLPATEPVSAEEIACCRAALDAGYRRLRAGGAPREVKAAAGPAGHAWSPGEHVGFATPLPGNRVVVRAAPETPLRVRLRADGTAQMTIALRDSAPPLDARELAAVVHLSPSGRTGGKVEADPAVAGEPRPRPGFFEVSESAAPPYWWSTQIPATFRLRQVQGSPWAGHDPPRDAVFVGELLAAGRLVQHGESGASRPRVPDGADVFRVTRPRPREDVRLVEPDLGLASARKVFAAPAAEGWATRVPAWGTDAVWVRMAPSTVRRAVSPRELDAEVAVLRLLETAAPGSAVRVAHRGSVRFGADRRGVPYLATSAPLGMAAGRCLGRAPAEHVAGWCVDLAADLLDVLEAIHAGDWCAGGLSPSLLHVRPAFGMGPPVLRAMLVALPLAGAAGTPVRREDLDRVPGGEPGLPPAGEARSPRADLASLGRLLTSLADRWTPPGHPLRELAAGLAAGRHATAPAALDALEERVPGRRTNLRHLTGPAERIASPDRPGWIAPAGPAPSPGPVFSADPVDSAERPGPVDPANPVAQVDQVDTVHPAGPRQSVDLEATAGGRGSIRPGGQADPDGSGKNRQVCPSHGVSQADPGDPVDPGDRHRSREVSE